MFIIAVIICFCLGIVFTLCVQYVIVRAWFSHQPLLYPSNRQQYGNFQLPKIVVDSFNYLTKTTLATKVIGSKPDCSGKAIQDDRRDSSIVLNVILQFLFAELKDTALVRRWATKKLNIEFQEMLNSKIGKFVNEIEVRDFNFGTYFPVIQSLQLKHVELSKDADLIQTFELMFDIIYEGDFQLTLDVDVIFGAWAYLSIIVRKLYGRVRVQFSRVPYTHWSFAFYEDPRLEFDVDSRFNGRPIPQISSLIISQIKRTIRKKHVLPAYRIRSKPIFAKPEDAFVKPDICFHGNKLVRGKLSVKVLRCGRLHDIYKDSKLFCTLSVDKEEIEEVWRQSWLSFKVHLNIPANTYHGLYLQDQVFGEKIEKRRVMVDGVSPDSPAGQADIRQGDIIEYISNTRVLSFKHALKQLRNVENVTLRIKRYRRKFSHIEDDPDSDAPTLNFDIDKKDTDKKDTDNEVQKELEELLNLKDKKTDLNQPASKLSEASPSEKVASKKFSERLSKTFYSKKKKSSGNKDAPTEDVLSMSEDQIAFEFDEDSLLSHSFEMGIANDKRQPAKKSSPHKHVKDLKGQRTHSDSSLYKVTDVDNASMGSDHGFQAQELRAGEVSTREVPFSKNPEWNEDFEFMCSDDDKFVNVCVWCRMVQTDVRGSKPILSASKVDSQTKNNILQDDLPKYNLTAKLGYTSIPLADIAAGCLITLQGDTQYTMYLHPPEETISASRTKISLSHLSGFDKKISHGDITLSFAHIPFKAIGKAQRKKIVDHTLNPYSDISKMGVEKNVLLEGQHNFKVAQFPSGTYCKFCGKKIWMKGASHCDTCMMICHKKCVDRCQIQTRCSRDGPKIASRPNEPWIILTKDEREEIDVKQSISLMNLSKFRPKDYLGNPVNIPKNYCNKLPSMSPNPSHSRQTLTDTKNAHLAIVDIQVIPSADIIPQSYTDGMPTSYSDKSLPGMADDNDSDDDITKKYRQPNYSLDDTIVIEAKEKGKALHADLSLPERKKTIDDMITKVKDTIDKESECKLELMKSLEKATNAEHKRLITNQLDKCDEKIEALMMMMVHYCAGLQNCLDQEDTNKRFLSGNATKTVISDAEIVEDMNDNHDVNFEI